MFLERSHVLRQIAAGQQTAVYLGVQGLDAAVQHLRELGDFCYFSNRQSLVSQQFGSTAGREQLNTHRVQGLGKFNNTGLIGDGEQCFHGATQ